MLHCRKSQPDYLFFDEITGEKYVVECKGTQTSRAESIHQLQRGTEQVYSIQPDDSKKLTHLVIATCLQAKKTICFIIDPPSENPDNVSKKDRETKNVLYIDGKNFRRNTRLNSGAKILSYAGLYDEAYQLIPEETRKELKHVPVSTGTIDTVETDLGSYDGSTFTIKTADNIVLEIFKGISSRLRNSFKKVVTDKNRITEEKVQREINFDQHIFDRNVTDKLNLTTSYERKDDLLVRSISRGGAILEVRIKK